MGLLITRKPGFMDKPGQRVRIVLPSGDVFFVSMSFHSNPAYEPRLYFEGLPDEVMVEREEIQSGAARRAAAAAVVTPDAWK